LPYSFCKSARRATSTKIISGFAWTATYRKPAEGTDRKMIKETMKKRAIKRRNKVNKQRGRKQCEDKKMKD
jgi:hypothetical protein